MKGCSRKGVTCLSAGSAAVGVGILQDAEAHGYGRGKENPAVAVRMELHHNSVMVRRADTEHERVDMRDPVGARVLREARELALPPAPVADYSGLDAAGTGDSSSGTPHKSGDRKTKDRKAEDRQMEDRKAEVTRRPDRIEADDRYRPMAQLAVPVLRSGPERVRIDARWPKNADSPGPRDHPVAGASEAGDHEAG